MPETDNILEDILQSANGYAEEDRQTVAVETRKLGRGAPPDSIPKVTDMLGEGVKSKFEKFLENFTEEQNITSTQQTDSSPPYIAQIHQMSQDDSQTIYVDYEHLLRFDETLAKAISEQYYRFLPYLRRAVQTLVKRHAPDYVYTDSASTFLQGGGMITRDFTVAFYNLPGIHRVRELRTNTIGTLLSITGTVTRTSLVRPELTFGAFHCADCGYLVKDVEQEFKYTEPPMCANLICQNRKLWRLDIENSKFIDWQRVRVQENSNEIPTGSMPRSLDVIVRNDIVERAKAGDKCIFTGTLIVVPDIVQLTVPGAKVESQRDVSSRTKDGLGSQGVTGLAALGVRDLTYKLSFLACMVQPAETKTGAFSSRVNDSVEEDQQSLLDQLEQEEIDELRNMVNMEKAIYAKLVKSIAPAVFGHDAIKKGILLQLMGGVHKVTPEGIHLRGDINVCIVGDPSTSKSQFLKQVVEPYVCGFLPRAIYTSGKASSAAGLTASVVKDEETGEFTIEAGALMLADNGICAIDEFDKMDIVDQVAIHEAMEQQTISIAKAGLHATLNARTSILAAANPVGGRYNRKLTLKQNVNMSPPIMSRFDLFFIVLDECNAITDYNIARHIVNVHRLRDDFIRPEFNTAQLQRYIRYARTFKPKLTRSAAQKLWEYYRILRQNDSQGAARNSYRITVRQLESMIRLSEAIARVYCHNEITESYVQEAYVLLQKSIIRVEHDDVELENEADDDSNDPNNETMDVDMGDDKSLVSDTAPVKKKVSINYEKYDSVVRLVVTKLRSVQSTSKDDDKDYGMKRNELIDWYLEQKEDELEGEEDLEKEKQIISMILKKLVKEGALVEIGNTKYNNDPDVEEEPDEEFANEPTIVIHPQCKIGDD